MKSDALRGHLDALILAVLEREPLHGYAIMEALQSSSGGALELPTGSLYPALRRLERAGHLRSEWSTVAGRKRRTYELTTAGKRALTAERAEWRDFAAAVEGVLRPGPKRA
ncbi:PadR family transcriptional regulator [Streptomyces chrestomyceticus JCM 4735]|uniref:PadR family transcriptional regulator n=1 Tax=Streptomyces chrestomyceticus JCM 4735 TaxID=1306181 RepID=A0A7U9PTU4_9ACTN|nr:PadR family transcriptional regulator [Streptomyces chrestomyceticus]GCD32527.1 PadR family transcriptional regulator [Streptomyces chrestomyceticus JCM 4735]